MPGTLVPGIFLDATGRAYFLLAADFFAGTFLAVGFFADVFWVVAFFLAAGFLAVFFFAAGFFLSGAWVSTDAASFLISVLVNFSGDFSALEARLAIALLVFSFFAIVRVHSCTVGHFRWA